MAVTHEPTEQNRRTVESMTAFGIPQAEICKVIKISKPTLRKYYREELDTAATKANSRVGQTIYSIAIDPSHRSCISAAIFWAKTRMGWRETNNLEVSGPDGGPVAFTEIKRVIVDPAKDGD